MALLDIYRRFLASPTTAVLADKPSINYVPTLTTINESSAIIRHLAAQAKVLNRKGDRVLSAIETADSLCVESETTIEFLAGGGALLPGLDDNFLTDKTAIFPMVHVVQFNSDGKIRQIRLYWDQGSLLKQLDVIGSRGRNWPLRDGKDQVRMIATSSGTPTGSRAAESSHRATGSRDNDVVISTRSHASSVTSATGDPHATLSLFQPREVNIDETGPANVDHDSASITSGGPSVALRSSAKPPARDLTDILSGTEPEPVMSPGSPFMNPPSPRKSSNGGAPKGGAGKNYHAIRLFDDEDDLYGQKSPEKKGDPKKYNHFEFGDGEAAGPVKLPGATKHQSQWDFSDFNTPEKPRMKLRTHDKRNFDWENNEPETSPVQRPVVHHARPDAEPHFKFVDNGTPVADKPKPANGGRSDNEGLGLYKDNPLDLAVGDVDGKNKMPLSTSTNINKEHRQKDFDSQFEMADQSPSVNRATGAAENVAGQKKMDDNRAKVLKGLNATWDMYDESPNAGAKENLPGGRGIKTTGDGIGGRKDSVRHWGYGDDVEEETRPSSKNQASSGRSFWDF